MLIFEESQWPLSVCVSTVSLSRVNLDLYFATHVMCRLLMLCLSWNSLHGHSRSLCGLCVEVIAVSLLEHVHRGWKSLQAAVWPPSAKALGQGVGQQESGFQHYRKSPKLQDFPVANKCALTASGFFLP